MRALDARGVVYETKTHDATGAFHSADEAAALLGVSAADVYKTLVVLREGTTRAKPLLVMIPAISQIDLKALATSIGEKKLRMATQREAEQLTAMQAGGISALGLLRPARFDMFIDESARNARIIHITAAVRGVGLALAVGDLLSTTNGVYVRAL